MSVKVCGITRPEQAIDCVNLGADAIGLVFVAKSRRVVDLAAAREIVRVLPPFVCAVGLFLDAEAADVDEVLSRVPLNLLQFHGSESPEYCRHFRRPYLKAVAMADQPNLNSFAHQHDGARGLLLDAHASGELGGTGERFDWGLVPTDLALPIVLAGGLNPDNVAEAVQQTRPAGVDVSSGVELRPGIKDLDRVRRFIVEVKRGTTT